MTRTHLGRYLFATVVATGVLAPLSMAQEPAAGSVPAAAPQALQGDLSLEQAQLADRWDRLEQIAARLAELSASSDPHRADLLRKAIAQAREKEVHLRFETIVDLLEKQRYNVASRNQETLEAELQQLLELLLKENRAEELRSQQAWLRMQLKEVNRIIRLQRGVKARTEGGDDTDRLAEDQQKVGERTGELAEKVNEAKGGSPDGTAGQGGESNSQAQEGEGTDSESEGEQSSQQESEDASDELGEDASEGAQADGEGGSESKAGSGEGQSSEGSQSGSGEQPKPSDSQDQSPSQNGSQMPEGQDEQDGQDQQNQSSEGQPSQGQGTPSEGGEGGAEGETPPPSSNPDENLQRRLRAAQENMQRARQKLEEAERSGAAEEQEKALRELEEAKADLERILRQLREEEMERTLALLEARFRKMLQMQLEVYEGTLRLDRIPEDARDHDEEIEAGRLSRQEEAIAREADKAIEILLDEGTSVAFPEAVTQMRSDMQEVVQRLAQLQVGELTQRIEEDIIEQLEESIEALQKALEELEKNKTPPGQAPPPGEPEDPKLVEILEEVKMIRALQMRINRRTQRYSEMVGGSLAERPQLLEALRQLALRQERVYKATRDLHLGTNQ